LRRKEVKLSFEREGEFIVILGPSGCGEFSLIRMVSGLEVILGIRPEPFELAAEGAGMLNISVDHVEILGADTLVYGHFGEDNARLTVRLPALHRLKKNTILPLVVSSKNMHIFDKESGKRIEK